MSDNKAFAGLAGVTARPTGYINFTLFYRNYDKNIRIFSPTPTLKAVVDKAKKASISECRLPLRLIGTYWFTPTSSA